MPNCYFLSKRNFARFEQDFQIKTISPFGSDAVCLLPRSSSVLFQEAEEELKILDSSGESRKAGLQLSSAAVAGLAAVSSFAATNRHIFLTAPTVTPGIVQYEKDNGRFVRVFAEDVSNITDLEADDGEGRDAAARRDGACLYVCTCRPRHGSVLVYNTNGVLLQSLIQNIYPISISFDREGHLHLIRSKRKVRGEAERRRNREEGNIVEVYNDKGSKITSYGKGHSIGNPLKIICHPHDDFTIVLDSLSLVVFHHGNYLYSVDASENGISDFAITDDGNAWIAIGNNELLKINTANLLYVPPPPLSLICQSATLVHLAELPFHLLPLRYTRLLEEWSQSASFTRERERDDVTEEKDKREGQRKMNETVNLSKELIVRGRKASSQSTLRLLAEKKRQCSSS